MLNLVIATTNKGKVAELTSLLEDFPINLVGLNKFVAIPEVEETGRTFAENARLKARYYAKKTNCWALADDSGLEVQALTNAPGIFSARYAGEDATDQENIAKLLKALENVEDSRRTARFVCEMAIANEQGQIKFTARGICSGRISRQSIGKNGFGYDPIFIPDGYSGTFGKLSNKIKQRISHRSKATEQIFNFLGDYLVS